MSDGKEGVLCIPQSCRITGASSLENLASLQDILWRGVLTRQQRCSRRILQSKPTEQGKNLWKGYCSNFIIIIMSCRQHGYPWPSLATSSYYSSPLAGLQGYIPYPHIAAVCMFELIILLLLGDMRGSIGVHHWWARPCFSSSVMHVWLNIANLLVPIYSVMFGIKSKVNKVYIILFWQKNNFLVNWITMTRKSSENLRVIYGNTGQLFRPY